MLAVNRLNADIPSPSLHLLGSDAGLRANISPLLTSFADDGHNQNTSRYGRDKLLPDIPVDAHTASPNGADVYTSFPPGQHVESNAMAHAPAHSRSPVTQAVRLFTTSNSARATLGAHASKSKAPNFTNTPKLLSQHLNQQDRTQIPWQLSPNNSVISSAANFLESPVPEVLNISPMNSSIVLKESPRVLSLEDTPPRTASIRKGPPVPIKIPNGRIHAPAVLVERDVDLADLESHISVSIRAPKLPRKSTKRSKTREQPIKSVATASRRPSHASSLIADPDDVLTEASNDEFRFSLGFLLQPERSSVMTTRTGRADSATLPELSPFFASDNFIPPVPIIPPSLALSGTDLQRQPANSSEESFSLKNTGLSKPLKQQRVSGMIGGMSPLASAYSQLTANSRPYNGGVLQDRRLSKKWEEENATDYSPVFTAASPLDSPYHRHQQTVSIPLPAEPKTPVKLSPALRRVAEAECPPSSASSKSDLDSPPIKSPGSPSQSFSTTPELSPSRKPDLQTREFSVLTPESGSSSSQDNSSDGFDIIQLSVGSREPLSLPSERRTLPKSAVPMSAVSPELSAGLSTGSIDGYLDTVIIDNRPPIKRILLEAPPAVSGGAKYEAAPSSPNAKKEGATFAPNHQKPPAAQGGEPRKLKFPSLEGPEFPPIIRPVIRGRSPSLPSPVNTSHPGILERRPSAPSPLTGAPSAIMFTPSSHQPLQAALDMHANSGLTQPPANPTGQRRRALDDTGLRASDLSIKTDHIRTAPRQGLFPYTPFSQASDTFTPAPASLGGQIELMANNSNKAPLESALSTAMSVKLATRGRTRPPTGPRKPKISRGTPSFKYQAPNAVAPLPVVAESPKITSTRSRSNTEQTQLQSPFLPSPAFHTSPVRFCGLTLDVAKWTFSQEELQELSRRAICHSADPLSIRLLPSTVLDKDVPTELERLGLLQEDLKANYKYQYRRRQATQRSLSTLLGSLDASGASVGAGHVAAAVRLVDELHDIANKSDQISEELYMVSDQISQLRSLLDNHSASALAMALRKINTSFMKASAETADLKTQIAHLTAEKEDAWAMADGLERELNHAKAQLEKEMDKDTASPQIKSSRRSASNTVEDVPTSAARVFAARKLSIRRSKANLRPTHNAVASPAPFSSALYTGGSIQSYYDAQPSGDNILNVQPLDSAGSPQSANTRNRLLYRRSESFSGTPLSSSRALANAQNELLQILGVPVRGMTDGGFRRTRSFSDADFKASMLPPSPPLDGVIPAAPGSSHRESRITSLYGAYMTRSNSLATRRMTKTLQTASQWDMEAIYDGILDDPDTLFAVVKPGL